MSSSETPASSGARGWSLQQWLTWRLTLAIGLLLGGLFLVLDVLVDRTVYARLDQFLSARAEAFAVQIARHDPEQLTRLLPAYDLAGHTEFFALFDPRGRLRLASTNSGQSALSLPASSESTQFYDTRLPDGHRGRAVVLRLGQGRNDKWQLVMATERESWDRTERTLHAVLMGGTALATLLAVLLCLWLVRQAFSSLRAEGQRLSRLRPGENATPAIEQLPRELQPYAIAVRDALQRLMNAAERERRFSRDIAHEMRTPLAEMRASTEHALDAGDVDAMRKGLQAALAANARMERGVQALLALARYESGQVTPAPDPLDLARLIRQQVGALAQAEGVDPGRRFDLHLPGPVWIHSDAGMLERILTNLLHNAHEYGAADNPVRVWMETGDAMLWLYIRNAAPGVEAGDLARFGERYWRGRGADADANHAGLGLALATAMAEALGLELGFALEHGAVVTRLGPFAAL